ncbi:MAG: ABC transporter permease [bacterium]|nr:ABC transporter permease [bacterium]
MKSVENNQMTSVKKPLSGIVGNSSFPSFLVLLVLLVVNAFLQHKFFSYRIFKSNFMSFTPLILASMAQAIVIISGSLDLSLGYAMSLFTVITAYSMTDTNVLPVLLLGFVCIVALSGVLNGFLIGKLRMSPLITTFATMVIFLGIGMLILPKAGGYVPKFFYKMYRGSLLKVIPFPVCILLIAIGIWLVFRRTSLCRYMYAIGSNQDGAYASGINVSTVRFMAHVIASIFIALAGLCVLMSTATGEYRSGSEYALNSVAAVVIGGIALTGGKGNISGAIFGALILGLLNNIIFFSQLSSFYQLFAKGIIIVIALSFGGVPQLLKEKFNF